ncbi:MAG: hypothetical protein R2762_12215 [Bryobacteraceae bacterium]
MTEEPLERIATSMGRVRAPGELWARVESGLDRAAPGREERRPRRGWPALGVAFAAVAAFALTPNNIEPRAVFEHRSWSEQGAGLDLYTADANHVRDFLGHRCGLEVSFEGPGRGLGLAEGGLIQRPRITGAKRMKDGSALVAFQVGPAPATLLVAAGEAAGAKQVAGEVTGGYQIHSWKRGTLSYTLVTSGVEPVRAACRLCHLAG